MKEFFAVLHAAALFSGISDEELAAMLSCLGARIDAFPKGSRLLRAGDAVDEVGLVLAGSALIVQEDIWGNRNILSKSGPGQTFAEVFACAPGAVLNVSVEAESAVTVMFLHIKRVLSMCPSACSHHNRIIRNLLGELAEKNLRLNEKLTHMGQRTTRAKLMSYFSVPFLLRVKEPPLGVLASADNPVSHGASGFCRWMKQLRSVEIGRTASARTI